MIHLSLSLQCMWETLGLGRVECWLEVTGSEPRMDHFHLIPRRLFIVITRCPLGPCLPLTLEIPALRVIGRHRAFSGAWAEHRASAPPHFPTLVSCVKSQCQIPWTGVYLTRLSGMSMLQQVLPCLLNLAWTKTFSLSSVSQCLQA